MDWKNLENNVKSQNRNGFFAGLTMDVTLPIVGLGVDFSVLYDNRIVTVPSIGSKADKTFHSIAIPLNVKYTFGLSTLISAYLATGPQVTYGLNNRSWVIDENVIVRWTDGWELNRSDLSWNAGGGVTLLNHFRLGYCYNIRLGHTNEFTLRHLGGQIERGELKENMHQLSLTYFF